MRDLGAGTNSFTVRIRPSSPARARKRGCRTSPDRWRSGQGRWKGRKRTNPWGTLAHLFTPKGGRLEPSLTSGLAWYHQIFAGQGGTDGPSRQKDTCQSSSWPFGSSTQLCRACMRTGGRLSSACLSACLPASQGFLGKDDHHSLRLLTSWWRWGDRHAPPLPCGPVH